MIPEYTKDALERYIQDRFEPGGFLMAVLSNDLKDAFGRADINNREAMFHIVSYLYNDAPANCWGSPEKVAQWLEAKS